MRHLAPSPRHTLRALACCALSALWVAPGHSWAADDPVVFSVTSTLGNIGYRLVDLDPNDGITPSISFTGTTALNTFDQQYNPETGGIQFSGPTYTNGLLPGNAMGLSTGNGSATASPQSLSVTSTLTLGQLTQNAYIGTGSASGYVYSMDNPVIGTDVAYWYAGDTHFTLSANTALEITGTTSVQYKMDGTSLITWLKEQGQTPLSLGLNSFTGETSQVSLKLNSVEFGFPEGDLAPTVSTATRESAIELTVDPWSATLETPVSEANLVTPFSLQFVNLSTQELTGDYHLKVMANASSQFYAELPYTGIPGNVPEPATWALMGLGLAGIGAASRRAQPRAASAH
jgi:hypothetical protein